jgi:hypothetical protein
MIYLNANNTVANPDLGFAGNYNDGTYHHTGVFRDASDGTWKFFYNYDPEPDASPYIDTAHASFRIANLTANLITDIAVIRGYDPINHTNTAFAHANAAFGFANTGSGGTAVDSWVRDAANAASSYSNSAYLTANTADQKAVTSGVYANSAFGVANSASSYANGSFVAANTADQKAVSAGVYANAAFTAANNAVDTWVRNAANSASSYANSAFVKANNALPLSGGIVSGDITANNLTANISLRTGNLYSLGNGALIELTDIGIISINPSGGSGAGAKFVGKTIEINS